MPWKPVSLEILRVSSRMSVYVLGECSHYYAYTAVDVKISMAFTIPRAVQHVRVTVMSNIPRDEQEQCVGHKEAISNLR